MASEIAAPAVATTQPASSDNLDLQRQLNQESAEQVQQMQSENIRFQMLMQSRANAYESRKEAIRSTRAN